MAEIGCLPLRQVTDGPLFSAGPGTLSALTNMELRPGGYAEARGGFEELKPSGGTAADAISAGGFASAHQITTSYGWIRTYDSAAGAGSQYSANKQLSPGAWLIFPTSVVNDAVYFGADSPFSRIGINLSPAAATWTVTMAYEYWNGSTWTALTTAETINFAVAGASGQQYASWTIPTTWVANTVGDAGTGNILKYWMRIRISVITLIIGAPRALSVFGSWVGMRETYVATQDPRTSGAGATIRRLGQTGTTTEWFSVGTSLFSGSSSPARMCSYRGKLVMVNGKEQKRWDGNSLSDLGLAPPGAGATSAPQAGAGYGASIRRVYIAFGYGPANIGSHQYDVSPLYGWSTAKYLSEVTTTGPNGYIRVDWSLLSIPSDVSALGFFVTDDLTNVPAAQRANFPAFLHDSLTRVEFAVLYTAWDLGSVTTNSVFPPREAVIYDNTPPPRCKFVTVYQNRLVIGDDNYWYWSDAFLMDSFSKATNYIALARAAGGRNMGCVEFADQVVLFTEDQTWGLTNIDLDVPQLFPIALGVGCVAPDAAVVVDGLLIWPARDGFYAWDGNKSAPKKISDKMKETFGKLNFETHGGSKAAGHNRRYDVRLSSPDYATIGSAYRFNIDSGEWATLTPTGFSSTMFPLTTIYAPLGNADAGAVHPLWGKVDYGTGAGEYTLFIGEQTTQDNGSNYTCSATMHFPLPPGALLTPSRVKAYYQASDGWGTPSFTNAVSDPIGSGLGTLNTGTPDTGSDYSIIGGTFSAVPRGASDHQVTFSVTSAAGGAVNRQRLFGGLLEGLLSKIRRGGV